MQQKTGCDWACKHTYISLAVAVPSRDTVMWISVPTSVISVTSFHFNFEPVTWSFETTHHFSNYRLGVLRVFKNIWGLVFVSLTITRWGISRRLVTKRQAQTLMDNEFPLLLFKPDIQNFRHAKPNIPFKVLGHVVDHYHRIIES